jgi:hypothetical protein
MTPSHVVMGISNWWSSRQMCKKDGGALGKMGGARTRGSRGGGCGPGVRFGMGKADITTFFSDKAAKGDKTTFKDVAGCDE